MPSPEPAESAHVDDEPQSTYYFGVEDGKVVMVSLQLKEQDCVN